jgi:hypothetical protein
MRTKGRRGPPTPTPVVALITTGYLPSLELEMMTEVPASARGTITLDGSDADDQPAPVRARTLKVYDMPTHKTADISGCTRVLMGASFKLPELTWATRQG